MAVFPFSIPDLTVAEEALTLVDPAASTNRKSYDHTKSNGLPCLTSGAHSSLLCGHRAQNAHAQSEREAREQHSLEERLLAAIRGAKHGSLSSSLAFPEGMLALVAGHIMSEAEGEPYGLKGKFLKTESSVKVE